MGCNCGGNRAARRPATPAPRTQATTASAAAVSAGSKVFYEVWRNGRYTGRRSDSISQAQQLATRMGGEVKPSR